MPATGSDRAILETWSTPECPFVIEYSRRVLEEIRLAVIDAFFSLPRGGAEIGGVLFGKFGPGRLLVTDYSPLECEHAFGPSFTLSPRDQAHLAGLAGGRKNELDRVAVGWYHSHTRSEIFLSEADLEIHNRYFPEPWQIALVLRPSTFQPTRAGFFFRAADGSIQAQASYAEFVLDPLPAGTPQVAAAAAAASAKPAAIPAAPLPAVPSSAASSSVQTNPAPPPATKPEPLPPAVPSLLLPAATPSRRWLWASAIIIVSAALGGFGYQARERWIAKPPPPALHNSIVETTLPEDHASRQATSELQRQNAELNRQISSLRGEKDQLARQAASLQSALTAETERSKKLEAQLDDLRKQQQKKRLGNQAYDPLE